MGRLEDAERTTRKYVVNLRYPIPQFHRKFVPGGFNPKAKLNYRQVLDMRNRPNRTEAEIMESVRRTEARTPSLTTKLRTMEKILKPYRRRIGSVKMRGGK